VVEYILELTEREIETITVEGNTISGENWSATLCGEDEWLVDLSYKTSLQKKRVKVCFSDLMVFHALAKIWGHKDPDWKPYPVKKVEPI
jgi:hypothetical protein